MKQELFKIHENYRIAENTYLIKLSGDTSEMEKPGTFVNIKIEGLYLRRPLSVCDSERGILTLIYKTVGEGTMSLAEKQPGAMLDILTGLGNGYNISVCKDKPLLIGGGCGVPPLYMLAKKLRDAGKVVSVILGFNKKSEVFFEDEFKKISSDVIITSVDGSYGTSGFVTTAMKDITYNYFYTCGPEPMLRAVYTASGDISGQFSFEERMGCGFGACMGCTCKTKYGNKRICKDGPVLVKEEIIW